MPLSTEDRGLSSRQDVRLTDRGHLANRLAHEIRNPLNAMRMQAAVIRQRLERCCGCDPDLDVAREQLVLFNREIARLEKLVQTFLEKDSSPGDGDAASRR
jgi:signal transduction histidine kinase